MSLWRNRLARSAVNRKVGGSSPPRDVSIFVGCSHITICFTIHFDLYIKKTPSGIIGKVFNDFYFVFRNKEITIFLSFISFIEFFLFFLSFFICLLGRKKEIIDFL